MFLYNHHRWLQRLHLRRLDAYIVGYGDVKVTGVPNPLSMVAGISHYDSDRPRYEAIQRAHRRGEAAALSGGDGR
jgi:hypothetical protein